MVGLGVVRRNSKDIMRRTKTSGELKVNGPRRGSLQIRSPYFWNSGGGGQDSPRKGSLTARTEISSQTKHRSKSFDGSCHIWDLADVKDGVNNIKLIQMADDTRADTRKVNPIFPPIPAKSLRNPRLLSAKSSSRGEKTPSKKNLHHTYDFTHSINDHTANIASDLLAAERSNAENFTHGLPDDSQSYSTGASPMQRSQTTFSCGTKGSDRASQRGQHNRATKFKASSLHSRSSEGSCNSDALRAKLARRRQSLPATPSSLVPAKSREFHKAFKELSRKADDANMGMKRSSTATSLKTLSDKVSTTASSNTPRDGLTVKPNNRRDSLQRIEEIPLEQLGTPVFTVNEETKDDCDVLDNDGKDRLENGVAEYNEDITSNAVDTIVTGESSIHHKTGHDSTAAEHSHKHSNEDNAENGLENHAASYEEGEKPAEDSVNVVTLSKKALTAIRKTVSNNPEILVNSIAIDDDDSVIDASILNEPDEDLCDTDFREKRIIQWIISAESGDSVEQLAEPVLSPSPTSRETAITIIYDG